MVLVIDIIDKHNYISKKALSESQLNETKANMILTYCFRTAMQCASVINGFQIHSKDLNFVLLLWSFST